MVFRNACTVQPKAWPAGGAVTVADSELIRIPSPRGTRPMRTRTRRAPPITGPGRLPQLDLALGTRHRDRLAGCQWAHARRAGRASHGLGRRVPGSQPLVARKPPRAQGVEHVATSGGWRTRFGSWGRGRWVVLAVLVVAVAVAVILIVLYAGGGSGGGGY